MNSENYIHHELTPQGQNTYSNSEGNNMPDAASPDLGPTSPQDSGVNDAYLAQVQRVAMSENSPPGLREAAFRYLTELNRATGEGQGFIEDLISPQAQPSEPPREGAVPQGPDGVRILQDISDTLKAGNRERQYPADPVERAIQLVMEGRGGALLEQTILTLSRNQRDHVFNSLFRAVDSREDEFTQEIFGQISRSGRAYDEFISVMEGLVASNKITDPRLKAEFVQDFERYKKEKTMRLVIHDVTAILHVPGIKAEQFFGYVEKFESSLLDMALTTKGVRQMFDLYEYAIRESMAMNDGILDPEKIRNRVDSVIDVSTGEKKSRVVPSVIEERAKQLFKEMMERGLIKDRARDGQEVVIQGLADWEVDRIFNVARGVTIASGRMISLAAESNLSPKDNRFASGFLQDLVQEYSALRHTSAKWYITAEALAAYLYKGTTGNFEKDNLFKRWNPHELKEMWARFQEDPDKVLKSLNEVFYLGKINPNRAGDILTWISWRGVNKSDVKTMFQSFLQEGERKMVRRWNTANRGGANPSAETYLAFMKDARFKVPDISDEDFFNMTKEERKARKERLEHALQNRSEVWAREHPNAIGIDEFEKYYQEYTNWTGTGFRFEKMRAGLEKAVDYATHGDHHEEQKQVQDAMTLLKRISEIQGHRLYGKSMYIRKRVKGAIEADPQLKDAEKLRIALGDMQLAESAMLNAREELINSGILFNDVQLDMASQGFDFFERGIGGDAIERDQNGNVSKIIMTRAERIANAKKLAKIMRDDFTHNESKYHEEFIVKREYTHGFVLWGGDVNIDEWNALAVGATGALVRRARDNKNQALATGEEAKMLDNLKNIHDPKQIIEHLEKIFAPIDHYDRGKAQQAVAEKLAGVIRFYKADSLTKLPLGLGLAYKMFKGGKISFAKMMYGPHALAMESTDINLIIEHLAHTKKITHEQETWLKDMSGASKKHIAWELGLNFLELGLMAFFMEMMSMTFSEIAEGAQEG